MKTFAHRIVLTENCNASCSHCFNAEVRNKNEMDADIFIKFMRENSKYLIWSHLKIMGGEPTLHPRIDDIVEEALKHYASVNIFTNGLNVKKYSDDRVGYTINGYVFDPEKFTDWKFLVLHFVIIKNKADKVIAKMIKCMDLLPQARFLYSPDTQVNIFDEGELNDYRKTWMRATKIVVHEFNLLGTFWNLDHRLPLCFFTDEMKEELESIGLDHRKFTSCKCNEVGLITSDFDLYYCNQTRIKLGSTLNKSIPEINEMIQVRKKINHIKCNDCEVINKCGVGCYYNQGGNNAL
jgi:radical SAM protein with 4Fe4S-binding SPASM domain